MLQDPWKVRVRRLRLTMRTVLQATVAAMLSYAVVSGPLGHEEGFFAPIAAVLVVAVSQGNRLRRNLELMLGVTVGIALADLVIAVIGTGVWQLGIAVSLTMTAAVLLGGSSTLLMQSASSAILIATLNPPTSESPLFAERFIDALVGGSIGLISAAILVPSHPVRVAQRATEPLLTDLEGILRQVAAALRTRDLLLAKGALASARDTQARADALPAELEASREVSRVAPVRWGQRAHLDAYLDASRHIDNGIRNSRVLARQTQAAVRRGEPVPDVLPEALDVTADAAAALCAGLASGDNLDEACTAAVTAARLATAALQETSGPFGQVVAVQARSIAIDLLLAQGLDTDDVARMLPEVPRMRH